MRRNPSKSPLVKVFIIAFFIAIQPAKTYPAEPDPSSGHPYEVWVGVPRAYLYDSTRTNSSPASMAFPLEFLWKKNTVSIFNRIRSRPALSMSLPITDGRGLYIGSKKFYSLDLFSGKTLWKFTPDAPIEAAAAVDDKRVYFGSAGGMLYCLEKNTGKFLWQFQAKSAIHSSPAISDGTLYLMSADNRIHALKKESGTSLWTYTHSSGRYVTLATNVSPILSEDKVFTLFPDGFIVALEKTTGRELWKKKLFNVEHPLSQPRITPMVGNGILYVIDAKRGVTALDRDSGEKLHAFDVTDAEDFALSKNILYVLSDDGLSAFDIKAKTLLWHNTIGQTIVQKNVGKPLPRSLFASDDYLFVISDVERASRQTDSSKDAFGFIEAFSGVDGQSVWSAVIRTGLGKKGIATGEGIILMTKKGAILSYGR